VAGGATDAGVGARWRRRRENALESGGAAAAADAAAACAEQLGELRQGVRQLRAELVGLPPRSTDTLPPRSTDTLPPRSTDTLPPRSTDTLPPRSTDTLPPRSTDTACGPRCSSRNGSTTRTCRRRRPHCAAPSHLHRRAGARARAPWGVPAAAELFIGAREAEREEEGEEEEEAR
jgi:hypothetical protein